MVKDNILCSHICGKHVPVKVAIYLPYFSKIRIQDGFRRYIQYCTIVIFVDDIALFAVGIDAVIVTAMVRYCIC